MNTICSQYTLWFAFSNGQCDCYHKEYEQTNAHNCSQFIFGNPFCRMENISHNYKYYTVYSIRVYCIATWALVACLRFTVVSSDLVSFATDKARLAMPIDLLLPFKSSTKWTARTSKWNISSRRTGACENGYTDSIAHSMETTFRCATCRAHVTVTFAVAKFSRSNSNDLNDRQRLFSDEPKFPHIFGENIMKKTENSLMIDWKFVCKNPRNESNLIARRSNIVSIAHPEFSTASDSFLNEFLFLLSTK